MPGQSFFNVSETGGGSRFQPLIAVFQRDISLVSFVMNEEDEKDCELEFDVGFVRVRYYISYHCISLHTVSYRVI